MKRNVIIVTDGDRAAQKAVQVAAKKIGGRCISLSAGNPTWISGPGLVELIKLAPCDPVVVMVDDNGRQGAGKGETAMAYIMEDPGINVLGILAVASNSTKTARVKPDCCINRNGEVTLRPVDKNGYELQEEDSLLAGDTVEILNELEPPVIVGIGDIGKMDGIDDGRHSAPLTTRGLQEILNRSGYVERGRS